MKNTPIIYIAEHNIFQIFDLDAEKSVFLSPERFTELKIGNNGNEYPINFAVISNNISFSKVSEIKNLQLKQSFKFSEARVEKHLKKIINSNHKNETYFLHKNFQNEYGFYHGSPQVISSYYQLTTAAGESFNIKAVIPYDYLVIRFLENYNKIIADSTIFIEESEEIYKIVVIVNGFTVFPVKSFKADMLKENIGLIMAEIKGLNIQIKKLATNSRNIEELKDIFNDVETILFKAGDFFNFLSLFNEIIPEIPYFESLDVKISKIKNRQNKKKNGYIIFLIIANIAIWIAIYSLHKENKIYVLNIAKLRNKSVLLSRKIEEINAIKILNGKLNKPNIAKNLKLVISILPKNARILSMSVKKDEAGFIVNGRGIIKGNYKNFTVEYNKMLENSLVRSGNIRMSYDLKKFNYPIFKFHMIIKKQLKTIKSENKNG